MTSSSGGRRRERPGTVITFYSYKGGAGRTQALANVAFLLAAQGYRVCAIDWDLEAPGMHRYFHPFLPDPHLKVTKGLVEYLWDLSAVALTPSSSDHAKPVDIRDYHVSVDWEFAEEGCLHLIPAGRQDDDYPRKAMSFPWEAFYERMGGGNSLEAARRALVADYHYVLIDSRTGISDTSGICTIQMPDRLVACYTLNRQSIDGVSNVLETIRRHRAERHLQIFPLEMRVETSEKFKLEAARRIARPRFEEYLELPARTYWEDMEIGYWPFYAFEECLAVFGDDPQTRSRSSMIHAMERVAAQVAGLPEVSSPIIGDAQREQMLRAYALGEYAPGAMKPSEPLATAADDKAAILWAEAAARHLEWSARVSYRSPLLAGPLAEGKFLLPVGLSAQLERLRPSMPERLRADPSFLLYLGKSRDWQRRRLNSLIILTVWICLVAVGSVFAYLARDYSLASIVAGGGLAAALAAWVAPRAVDRS